MNKSKETEKKLLNEKNEVLKEKTRKIEKTEKIKKIRKNITSGIAFVQATFNNTIVTISDDGGNVIAWSSAGSKGF